MAGIPAYCTNTACGAIFVSNAISISHSSEITLEGNTTTCPQCRSVARFVDGVFNELGKGLELVSGPPITRAILKQLQAIAEKANSGEITPQEAVQEATKVDPRLGKLFERFLALGMTAFAALFAFLGYQLQQAQYDLQKADSDASEQFYEEALEILERQAEALENEKNDERVERERRAPAAEKSDKDTSAVKRPSKRRAEVNKARRKALRERRRMFPRRGQRKPSS